MIKIIDPLEPSSRGKNGMAYKKKWMKEDLSGTQEAGDDRGGDPIIEV